MTARLALWRLVLSIMLFKISTAYDSNECELNNSMVDIADIIICVKFCNETLRGMMLQGVKIQHFPLTLTVTTVSIYMPTSNCRFT